MTGKPDSNNSAEMGIAWRPDGASTRARIGVLTPHMDPVPETELKAMAPAGVSIHTARVPFGMKRPDGEVRPAVGPDLARAFAESPELDDATAQLAALAPAAVVYAFTSSSYVLGATADHELARRLRKCAQGVAVVVQSQAIVRALAALGADRIHLVHPPWFSNELDELGARYFIAAGIDVVKHAPARVTPDNGEIHPARLFDYVVSEVPSDAAAVVIAGGGFRAVGATEALEAHISRPVVTANQASLWSTLRHAGIDDRLDGYGHLFTYELPT